MPLRRMLLALVAIAAAVFAGTWIASKALRRSDPERGEVARLEGSATSGAGSPSTNRPRGGAGTVGARAGSLGAVAAPGERTSRASQPGDTGGAPRVAQDEGSDRGVESVPAPGRDPRDHATTPESVPPDPTTTATSGAPPRVAPTVLTADAPLSPQESEQIAEQRLDSLSPEEQAALQKIVIPLLTDRAEQPYDWTGPTRQ